ncbi:MAG: hypothetical protein ACHQQQ_15520 [Bacteroidota bacterium]
MKVQHKTSEEIEAVKFDGTEKCAEAIIAQFGNHITKNKNRQHEFMKQLCIATPTGTKFVYPGDFIVMSSKVGMSVFDEKTFNSLFEETTEGETCAEETGETQEGQNQAGEGIGASA